MNVKCLEAWMLLLTEDIGGTEVQQQCCNCNLSSSNVCRVPAGWTSDTFKVNVGALEPGTRPPIIRINKSESGELGELATGGKTFPLP